MNSSNRNLENIEHEVLSITKYRIIIIVMIFTAILMSFSALCLGRYKIDILDILKVFMSKITDVEHTWDPMTENVIFSLRLPRIIASLLVGSALALSGVTYQGVFKNPLVSPDLLGISSGACVGAALAILLGFGSIGIQISAFTLGIVTVILTTTIPKILKNDSITMLVLSGIIISGVMNSIMGIVKYLADPETQLSAITYWQMGSLAKVVPQDVLFTVPLILISTLILMLIRWKINILSLGDSEAKSLGLNIKLTRGITIICSTMLTACAVCICGTIGWVGLVIPHLGRMIVGPDNVRLLPISCVLGGMFMLFIDTLARVITNVEIPLSILTGLIGAPFYFYILSKQRMKLS